MIKSKTTLLAWVSVVAIVIVTYFVFSPSLDNGFTNWDDNVYVAYNPLAANNSIPVVKIFKTPVADNYHPLTVLSLALNYQNGKLDPLGYHFVNVIFHLLNTILVFLFIFLLTRRNVLMAAIVALFFGIHPMHVESVSWVSERKDVLYVFFFLAGLISYLRYSQTRKTGWYIFTMLLFLLSCLSKGMAIVFPVVLLLIDYLENTKWDKRFIIEKIPFFFLSVLFGIIAYKTQIGQNISAIRSFTIWQRVMFASYGAILYIVKLFVPFKLSAFYPYPITTVNGSVPLVFYFLPLILFVIILAIIYFFRRKEKEIVFGLLFYLVCVAMVLQLVPIGAAIMADRYSYLSYVGLLFVVAHLTYKIMQSKSGVLASIKYPVIIVVIIGAVVFSYRACSRTQIWKNSEVLWNDVIDKYPNAAMVYYNRGNYYYVNNEIEKAMADYNTALQKDSLYRDDYYNRAILYAGYYNRSDLAIADYTKAIALDPTKADAHTNRGTLYFKEGKINLAIADYTKAIALDSTAANAYSNRAMIYSNAGRNDLALADYNKSIAFDSTNADAYNNRGIIYLNTGKAGLALADFNRAIAINPTSVLYFCNRSLCYKTLDQYERAADDFTKAIQLNPQNAVLYNLRGLCFFNLQSYSAAITDFSKAVELNPSVAEYWLNRSLAESKTGQSELAKADELKAQQLQNK